MCFPLVFVCAESFRPLLLCDDARAPHRSADVYRFGAVLFSVYSGGACPTEAQINRMAVTSESALEPGLRHLDPTLRHLLSWCLDADPSNRPSISQVLV